MAELIYTALASLDGYVNDAAGNVAWAEPDAAVHACVNELEWPIGTDLLGRRMYEVMVAWEDMPGLEAHPAVVRDDAAIWRAADNVVYASTLPAVSSARTRLERAFDPDAVRRMKARAARDLGIGSPRLAARAFAAGLIDEVRLFLAPVAVGGGTPVLPADRRLDLELLDARRFPNGTVHRRYRVRAWDRVRRATAAQAKRDWALLSSTIRASSARKRERSPA